jgi:RHS repeat-associated protein
MSSLAAPNGNVTTYAYDPDGRPTGSSTVGTGDVSRATYAYTLNRAGQRLSEASTIAGDPSNGMVSFSYDPLGRLIGYSGSPVTSQAYAWDPVPNRTSKQTGTDPAVTTTYDPANRPTADSAGGSYTSDLDGRLTAMPGFQLTWDALGRLTAVKDAGGTSISAYTYDPLDRLASVTRASGVERFRYKGTTPRIVGARDGSGSVLWNVGTCSCGTARFDFGPGGTNRRFYGTNGHGDLTWTADATGAVTATRRYDPWGVPGQSTGSSFPEFRFQGSWSDTGTGLSWAVARWYAPALGRFISEDALLGTLEQPDSRQLYAYGAGEPVGRADVSGTFWYQTKSGDSLWSISRQIYGSLHLDWLIEGNPGRVTPVRLSWFNILSTLPEKECIWIPFRNATNQCKTTRGDWGYSSYLYWRYVGVSQYVYGQMIRNKNCGAGLPVPVLYYDSSTTRAGDTILAQAWT